MGNTRLTPTLGSIFNHFTNSGWFTGTLQELKDLFDASASALYQNELTTQYESPVTGATVSVTDGSGSIFLLLTPTGTLANLEIKLPTAPTNTADKQIVKVFSTQILSSLTWNKNSAADILGEPSTLAANGYLELRYDSQNNNWYRVG
jgi:hypothetical protein